MFGIVNFPLLKACLHDNNTFNTVAYIAAWSQAAVPDGEIIHLVWLITFDIQLCLLYTSKELFIYCIIKLNKFINIRGEIKYIAEFVDKIKTIHITTNLFKTLLDTVFCDSKTFFILGYHFPMVLKVHCYILFFGTPDLDLLQGHTGQCESYWVIFDPR